MHHELRFTREEVVDHLPVVGQDVLRRRWDAPAREHRNDPLLEIEPRVYVADLLGVAPGVTVLLMIGFTAIMAIVSQVQCSATAIGFFGPGEGIKPCLNGSLFYLPALGAMIVIGLLLHERGHKAAPWVLWAAAIFAVSVTLRSLDLSLCERVVIDGRKLGTHFAWHVLNALALFLLLRASLAVGATVAERKREPVLIEAEPIDLAAAAAKAAREAEAAAKERERKTLFPT